MAITLMRTSGSPVVTDAKDFSTCILDAKVEQIAFSASSPSTSRPRCWARGRAAQHERDESRRATPFMCNDPHTSGAIHQGDVGIVMPFFFDDELVAWGYVNEHVLDIGGSAVSGFALGAFDSFSETLAFPATRIAQSGGSIPLWQTFLATNVRLAGTVLNDIRSMIAANNAGSGASRYHVRDRIERFDALNERAKAPVGAGGRARIESLPTGLRERRLGRVRRARRRGAARGSHPADRRGRRDDDPVPRRPADRLVHQRRRPAMIGQAWTTCSRSFYDIPVNAGIWRRSTSISARRDDRQLDRPRAGLDVAHPDRDARQQDAQRRLLQACSFSDDANVAARVAGQPAQNQTYFTAFGIDRRNGAPSWPFPMSVGMLRADPPDHERRPRGLRGHLHVGCDMPDVEIEETSQPGMIMWRRVAPDTGGAGSTAAATACSTCLAILHCDRMTGGAYTEHDLRAAARQPSAATRRGRDGGSLRRPTSSTSSSTVYRDGGVAPAAVGGGPAQSPRSSSYRGDVYTVVHGGGGGVGDPLLRDPALVGQDVRRRLRQRRGGAVTLRRRAHERRRAGRRPRPRRSARPSASAGSGTRPSARCGPTRRCSRRLGIVDGRWRCALCEQDLGDEHDNWRAQPSPRDEISERYTQLRLEGPPRDAGRAGRHARELLPGLRAARSAVDVTLEGHDPVPASRPGVNDPYATAT
jgi:N-methylhydantoinase B